MRKQYNFIFLLAILALTIVPILAKPGEDSTAKRNKIMERIKKRREADKQKEADKQNKDKKEPSEWFKERVKMVDDNINGRNKPTKDDKEPSDWFKERVRLAEEHFGYKKPKANENEKNNEDQNSPYTQREENEFARMINDQINAQKNKRKPKKKDFIFEE